MFTYSAYINTIDGRKIDDRVTVTEKAVPCGGTAVTINAISPAGFGTDIDADTATNLEAGKIVDKWKITSLENLIRAVGKARTSPLCIAGTPDDSGLLGQRGRDKIP